MNWEAHATPPQYTDNEESVIEKGSQIRVKIIGVRSDVGRLFAVATMKEDYLGTL